VGGTGSIIAVAIPSACSKYAGRSAAIGVPGPNVKRLSRGLRLYVSVFPATRGSVGTGYFRKSDAKKSRVAGKITTPVREPVIHAELGQQPKSRGLQLGVNSGDAIHTGGLANNSSFFGSSTAETTSRSNATSGSWNNDYARSPYSSASWQYRGGRSYNGANAGFFAFNAVGTGGASEQNGHRTILSGY
jgi:hypothetical protein